MEFAIAGASTVAVLLLLFLALRKKPREQLPDEMTGAEFEDYCAELLAENGYIVEQTRASGDFGADLIISRDGKRTAVQCKHYAKPVGVKAVQEVIGSKEHYRCTMAAVMTNSVFTRQARTLATESGVSLWDGDFIAELENSGGIVSSELAPVVFSAVVSEEFPPCEFYIDKQLYHEGEFSEPLTLSLPYGEHTLLLRTGRKKARLRITIRDEGRRVFALGSLKNKPIILEIGI